MYSTMIYAQQAMLSYAGDKAVGKLTIRKRRRGNRFRIGAVARAVARAVAGTNAGTNARTNAGTGADTRADTTGADYQI